MNDYQILLDNLTVSGILKTERIISAFQKIKRADFLLEQYQVDAWRDAPLPIGYGQTNSQPTTVAFMLELLQPQEGDTVLDIGSGSGWTTALLAEIVGENGRVIGLEKVPQLVKFGQVNLGKYHFTQAEIKYAGEQLGLPGEKFDRILVSAAAGETPQALIKQLKKPGTMVVPVNDSIFKISKDRLGEISKLEFYGFSFVPLVN